MIVDFRNRRKLFFRIIAMAVVCLFLWNDVAFGLSPKLRAQDEEFRKIFEEGYGLLAHEAVKDYIARYIASRVKNIPMKEVKESDKFTEDKKVDLRRYLRCRDDAVITKDGRRVDVLIVAIPGLFAKRNQFAHLGLGKWNGKPVIYVDEKFFYDEEEAKAAKAELAKTEAGPEIELREERHMIMEHEEDEIDQASAFAASIHTDLSDLRAERILGNPDTKRLFGIFHDSSRWAVELARLQKKYNSLLGGLTEEDWEERFEAARRFGFDKNDRDVNIAAGNVTSRRGFFKKAAAGIAGLALLALKDTKEPSESDAETRVEILITPKGNRVCLVGHTHLDSPTQHRIDAIIDILVKMRDIGMPRYKELLERCRSEIEEILQDNDKVVLGYRRNIKQISQMLEDPNLKIDMVSAEGTPSYIEYVKKRLDRPSAWLNLMMIAGFSEARAKQFADKLQLLFRGPIDYMLKHGKISPDKVIGLEHEAAMATFGRCLSVIDGCDTQLAQEATRPGGTVSTDFVIALRRHFRILMHSDKEPADDKIRAMIKALPQKFATIANTSLERMKEMRAARETRDTHLADQFITSNRNFLVLIGREHVGRIKELMMAKGAREDKRASADSRSDAGRIVKNLEPSLVKSHFDEKGKDLDRGALQHEFDHVKHAFAENEDMVAVLLSDLGLPEGVIDRIRHAHDDLISKTGKPLRQAPALVENKDHYGLGIATDEYCGYAIELLDVLDTPLKAELLFHEPLCRECIAYYMANRETLKLSEKEAEENGHQLARAIQMAVFPENYEGVAAREGEGHPELTGKLTREIRRVIAQGEVLTRLIEAANRDPRLKLPIKSKEAGTIRAAGVTFLTNTSIGKRIAPVTVFRNKLLNPDHIAIVDELNPSNYIVLKADKSAGTTRVVVVGDEDDEVVAPVGKKLRLDILRAGHRFYERLANSTASLRKVDRVHKDESRKGELYANTEFSPGLQVNLKPSGDPKRERYWLTPGRNYDIDDKDREVIVCLIVKETDEEGAGAQRPTVPPSLEEIASSKGRFVAYPKGDWSAEEWIRIKQDDKYCYFRNIGTIDEAGKSFVVYKRLDQEERITALRIAPDRKTFTIDGFEIDDKPAIFETGHIHLGAFLCMLLDNNPDELGAIPADIRSRISVSESLKALACTFDDVVKQQTASMPTTWKMMQTADGPQQVLGGYERLDWLSRWGDNVKRDLAKSKLATPRNGILGNMPAERDFHRFVDAMKGLTFADILGPGNGMYTMEQARRVREILKDDDVLNKFGVDGEKDLRVVDVFRSKGVVSSYVKWKLHEMLIDEFIRSFYEELGENRGRWRPYGKMGGERKELEKIKGFLRLLRGGEAANTTWDGRQGSGQLNVLDVGDSKTIFGAHSSPKYGMNICNSAANVEDPYMGGAIVHELLALFGSIDDELNEEVERAFIRFRKGEDVSAIMPSLKKRIDDQMAAREAERLKLPDITELEIEPDLLYTEDNRPKAYKDKMVMDEAMTQCFEKLEEPGGLEAAVKSLNQELPRLFSTCAVKDKALKNEAERYLIQIVEKYSYIINPDGVLFELYCHGLTARSLPEPLKRAFETCYVERYRFIVPEILGSYMDLDMIDIYANAFAARALFFDQHGEERLAKQSYLKAYRLFRVLAKAVGGEMRDTEEDGKGFILEAISSASYSEDDQIDNMLDAIGNFPDKFRAMGIEPDAFDNAFIEARRACSRYNLAKDDLRKVAEFNLRQKELARQTEIISVDERDWAKAGDGDGAKWRELAFHMARFKAGNPEEKITAISAIGSGLLDRPGVPRREVIDEFMSSYDAAPEAVQCSLMHAIMTFGIGLRQARAMLSYEMRRSMSLTEEEERKRAASILSHAFIGIDAAIIRGTIDTLDPELIDILKQALRHAHPEVVVGAVTVFESALGIISLGNSIITAGVLRNDPELIGILSDLSKSDDAAVAHHASDLLEFIEPPSASASRGRGAEGRISEWLEEQRNRAAQLNHTHLSTEEIAEMLKIINRDGKSPPEFVRRLFDEERKKVVFVADASYGTSQDLPLSSNDILSLIEEGGLTHIALPIPESERPNFRRFVAGELAPEEWGFHPICGFPMGSLAAGYKDEMTRLQQVLAGLYGKVEFVLYGDDGSYEGELAVDYRAGRIKDAVDAASMRIANPRMLVLGMPPDMARCNVVTNENQDIALSVPLALGQLIGPDNIACLISLDEKTAESWGEGLNNIDAVMERVATSVGIHVQGTPLAKLHFEEMGTQTFGEAWDGLILRKKMDGGGRPRRRVPRVPGERPVPPEPLLVKDLVSAGAGTRGSPADLLMTTRDSAELLGRLMSEEGVKIYEDEEKWKAGGEKPPLSHYRNVSRSTLYREVKILCDLGMLIRVEGRRGFVRFSDMMRALHEPAKKDSNGTKTLLNIAIDQINKIEYQVGKRGEKRPLRRGDVAKEKRQVVKELVKMTVLHEINSRIKPVIPKGKVLWHILEEGVVSSAQAAYPFASRFNRAAEENSLVERLYIVKAGETTEGAIEKIRSEYSDSPDGVEPIFDVACATTETCDSLSDLAMKRLVFKGAAGDFTQVEGIIAALRALHSENARDAVSALLGIYSVLAGKAYSGDLSPDVINSLVNDPVRFAHAFIFDLPPVRGDMSKDLPKMNVRMCELMTSA